MIIVLMGPPGAGKGTQAAHLSKHFNIPHLSTGDVFRNAMANESTLGEKVKFYINKGELAPDQVVIDIVLQKLDQKVFSKGLVLDGFPRTLSQAEMFDGELVRKKLAIDLVLNLVVSEQELYKRIEKRANENVTRRSDDNDKILKNRIEIYNRQARAVIDFYRKKDLVFDVDGAQTANLVLTTILNKLNLRIIC
ncbi:MAG: adenylate kinase [Magnetovibrio sp.]|nr:adenylate kinase [Magnetovibrio sp.]